MASKTTQPADKDDGSNDEMQQIIHLQTKILEKKEDKQQEQAPRREVAKPTILSRSRRELRENQKQYEERERMLRSLEGIERYTPEQRHHSESQARHQLQERRRKLQSEYADEAARAKRAEKERQREEDEARLTKRATQYRNDYLALLIHQEKIKQDAEREREIDRALEEMKADLQAEAQQILDERKQRDKENEEELARKEALESQQWESSFRRYTGHADEITRYRPRQHSQSTDGSAAESHATAASKRSTHCDYNEYFIESKNKQKEEYEKRMIKSGRWQPRTPRQQQYLRASPEQSECEQ